MPGAGKTTVTFALHLLAGETDRLLVVAPRNAFMAWEEVIDECLLPSASPSVRTPFVQLVDGEARILEALKSQPKRLLITYGQLIRVLPIVEELLSRERVHLVLDEAHRMKAGSATRSGSALLRIASMPIRRDILTGTPMPQRPADLQSQLDFLWPGSGLGVRIGNGENPRDVLGRLYVRTTKKELGLGPRERHPVRVDLTDAHLAFYGVLSKDVHAQASALRRGRSAVELIRARRSVLKLLLAAVNPLLVAKQFADALVPEQQELLDRVMAEGPSARLRAAADLARALAAQGRKSLLWTNFRSSLNELKDLLQDLAPAVIDGSTTVGDEENPDSRQGQIRRFKTDAQCLVMLANPAAASEGMSLHKVCHDAIYVDRSYNATHYLQSIDRIHRLDMPPNTTTRVHVLENRLPADVGSIDLSVARRLGEKIRNMEQLLGDPDLHELALDEEAMGASIEDSIDWRDVDDLICEIESPSSSLDEEGLE
ncbi:SNF2-related protein [Roseateles sp. So40a]|uniref:SNF2-related protein n=1 Tax=Roseateles sp. So40a TaxID=3400226 RepID=UPI003A83E4D2